MRSLTPFLALFLWLALLAPLISLRASWDDPQAGQPVLNWFTPDDQFDTSRNLFAVVDKSGTLYVSGPYVWEFDGAKWSILVGARANTGYCMYLDSDDVIWLTSVDQIGYLEKRPDGHRRYVSLKEKLDAGPQIGTRRISKENGKVLFLLPTEILIWDGSAFSHIPVPSDSTCFQMDGKMIVEERNIGWFSFDGQKLVPLPTPEELKKYYTFYAYRRPDGSLLVGAVMRERHRSSFGIVHGDKVDWIEGENDPEKWAPNSLVKLSSGNIAIADSFEGILIFSPDGQLLRVVSSEDGLGGGEVRSLTKDSAGHLIAVTTKGICRFDEELRVSTLYGGNTLDGILYHSISFLPGGGIYMGTSAGCLSVSASLPKHGIQAQAMRGRFQRYVRTETTASGKLMLGSLVALAEKKASDVTVIQTPLLWPRPLGSSTVEPQNFFYADGQKIKIIHERGEEWDQLDSSWSLNGYPDRLVQTRKGELWVTTTKSLIFKLNPDLTSVQYTPGKELPATDEDWALSAGTDQLFAYTSHHVVIYRNGAWQPSPRFSHISLQCAETTFAGSFWCAISYDSGEKVQSAITLGRGSFVNGDLNLEYFDVPELEHLKDCFVVKLDPSGNFVWLCGVGGIFRVDTRFLRPLTLPAAPGLIRASWKTTNQTFDFLPKASLALKYDANSTLTVDVRNTERILAGPHTFESQLEGVDTGWTISKASRTLSRLREGTYTLRIRLLNTLGQPGPETALVFTILPPWQRSPWAYAGYAGLLAAGVVGTIRFQLRKAARRNAELEQIVKARTEELTRATAAKTEFLSHMGHEIRNPMNGVIGLAEKLRRNAATVADRADAEKLSQCASYLSSVVEDVLEFSQIDAGKIPLRLRAFRLGELLSSAAEVFAGHTQSGGQLRIDISPTERDASFFGDPDRIRQILVNYLANAFKFAPEGEILLQAARVENGELQLSVRDHGPGIPPAEQAQLFQRFSRGLMARRQNIPGTGLGLAACKAYAKAMGGRVWVESTPGQGARFFLQLPLALADAAETHPPIEITSTGWLKGRSALVVDDQDFNRIVFADMLSRLGCEADTAETVAEAKTLLQQGRYAYAFLDMDLADGAGDELARWIRSTLPEGKTIVLFAVSAFELGEIKQRAEVAGMNGFIGKPITPEKIQEALQRAGSLALPVVENQLPAAPAAGYLGLLARGDPAAAQKIREAAQAEAAGEFTTLAHAVDANDLSTAARHAHRLISIALMVDDHPLADTARLLRRSAQEKDLVLTQHYSQEIARLLGLAKARTEVVPAK